jgi:hypothetical protein
MAYIECTIQEYHEIIGPRIRNKINSLTRNARKERNGICENCGEIRELESAHIHGKGRRKIIEKVLENHFIDDLVKGDLIEFENEILEKHKPIENVFKFLCKPCHNQYDNLTFIPRIKRSHHKKNTTTVNQDFTKISRIKLWSNRQYQANHKFIQAFIEIAKNRKVTLDQLEKLCTGDNFGIEKNKFYGHFASMKSDKGNSHGKVFYENNGYVEIYPEVMVEIKKYFNS